MMINKRVVESGNECTCLNCLKERVQGSNQVWASIVAAAALITRKSHGRSFRGGLQEHAHPFIKRGKKGFLPVDATHREYSPYMLRLTSGHGSKMHVHHLLSYLEEGRSYTFTPNEQHRDVDDSTGVRYFIQGTALLRLNDVVYQWTLIDFPAESLENSFEDCIGGSLRKAAQVRDGVAATTVSIMMKLRVNPRGVKVLDGSCMIWGADFTSHVAFGKGIGHSCIANFARSLTPLVKVLCCFDPLRKRRAKKVAQAKSFTRLPANAVRKQRKKKTSRFTRRESTEVVDKESMNAGEIVDLMEAGSPAWLEDGDCGECDNCLEKVAAARRRPN